MFGFVLLNLNSNFVHLIGAVAQLVEHRTENP